MGIAIAMLCLSGYAQTQVVKGRILDSKAEYPLIGATIQLINHDPLIGTVADYDGNFKLDQVPIGRLSFAVSYIGYKSITLPNVLVTSGKEVILDIKLEESVTNLDAVVVTANTDKDQPINELAKVSARTFSLEEVTRFSGGRNDVARLATSFAGVSAPNDSRNDIVVRGNSPNGLLWRLEGIPLATTNHFATLGTTGGPVNALNTNLLRTSDFLTGAFPAEYGNANGAVFDINFRNGNTETYEFTGQMGFNGLELMVEGPISRKQGSSFVTSYRYGVASLAATGTSAVPYYQDIAFKVNLGETKLGKFEWFGMGALSEITFLGDQIDETDLFANPNVDAFVKSRIGMTGLNHTLRLRKNTFIKTGVAASLNGNTYAQDNFIRDTGGNKTGKYLATDVDNAEYRYTLTSAITHKFNARWNMKAGFLSELYNPTFNTRDRDNRVSIPDANGDGVPDYFNQVTDMDEQFMVNQLFAQAEYRLTDNLSFTSGLHTLHHSYTGANALEPRAAVSWQKSPRQRLSFAYGMHAQSLAAPILFLQEETSPGVFEQTNKNLDFSRAHHWVAGYDLNLRPDWRLKSEVYYQSINRVPVENTPSSYSILNEGADFIFDERGSLVNEGTGTNYGIEMTLEKFYSRGYYLLLTGSLYESTYTGSDGVKRNTAFNNQYVVNVLGGREWKFGKASQHAFTLDSRFTTSGGKPFSPIDLEATRANLGRQVFVDNQAFNERYGAYLRWDVKLGVRLNKPGGKLSQQFYVDLQNITNRENEFVRRYNAVTDEVNLISQIGFFPDILYRIQF